MKYFKKIVVVIAVAIIGIVLYLLVKPAKTIGSSSITVILENSESKEEYILKYNESESLYDVLNNNFKVYEKQRMIIQITTNNQDLVSNLETNFLAIYIKNKDQFEMSMYGAKYMSLKEYGIYLIKLEEINFDE
ncbi:hypothetical protein [Haploplasma modicum]|uniref:hypothetical protein n=1 Tax=Haploplasma modicum TaxID=2150 RepID=UPI00214CD681|nr:hypothetical protein [Haploplasma modicum]MCR1809013.1 hypothetical protein [Haploplasma modicum]